MTSGRAGYARSTSRTLFIAGYDFAILNPQIGNLGGKFQLLAIFRRIHEPLHGRLQSRLRNGKSADLAADGIEPQIAVLRAQAAFELQSHVLSMDIEDDVSFHAVFNQLDLDVSHVRTHLLDILWPWVCGMSQLIVIRRGSRMGHDSLCQEFEIAAVGS